MSYIGSKAKAQWITRILNHSQFDSMHFVEPFCGYCHITHAIRGKRSYQISDNEPLLICLLQAIQRGDALPPIDKSEYQTLKHQLEITLKRAVAAYQYSFNGKRFGGFTHYYKRPNGRIDNMVASRAKHYARLHASKAFHSATITCRDYRSLCPRDSLVYLDPPYADCTNYGTTFDSTELWRIAEEWSKVNIVFVSEYTAPRGWTVVASKPKQVTLAGGHKQSMRLEKLFIHSSNLHRLPGDLQSCVTPN